jgi:hypothetical protein
VRRLGLAGPRFSVCASRAFVFGLSSFVIFALAFGDRVALFGNKSLSFRVANQFSRGFDARFHLRVLGAAWAAVISQLGSARA